MGRTGRTLVAGFDALVMGAAAYRETGIPAALTPEVIVLWGSALAAAICAITIFAAGSPYVAWAAIGYVLFGAFSSGAGPQWPLVALAVALMPLVPRPRDSIALALGVAAVVAIGARVVITALL